MKQLITYVQLQWKRCVKSIIRSVLVLGVIAVGFGSVFWLIGGLFKEDKLSLVNVGVVIPREEKVSSYITGFISSMESVKSICKFVYYDSEEEAIEQMNKGNCRAAVVLPDGFFHDVQVGINPPAIIYFPEDANVAEKVFRELLISGVSFLQTAESSVYAALNLAYEKGSAQDISEIGNNLALIYVEKIFARSKMFSEDLLSPFGRMKREDYYFYSALVIFLSFFGIGFKCMYGRENYTVEDKLRINGMGKVKCSVIKILIMSLLFYLVCLIVIGADTLIGKLINHEIREYEGMLFGALAILAVTLALYYHVIFSLCADTKTAVAVIIILCIIGVLISGLVVPENNLSQWAAAIGKFTPQRLWMRLLLTSQGYGGVL